MATDVRPIGQDSGVRSRPQAEQEVESRVFVASQWQLMWWKFRKHKIALLSGVIIILIYLIVLFAEFLAPFTPERFSARHTYAPPQPLHLFDTTAEGTRFNPYVNGYKVEIDQVALRRTFVVDEETKYYVNFLVEGEPYKLLWFYESNIHLIGPENNEDPMYLLGADRLGRDVLSRLIYGTRISMTIGLVGVALSFVFGILLGGISGFYGGAVDNLIQRVIEFIRSIPSIPLWMALAAAVPSNWSIVRVYFMITIILSFIGWTGLARVVRGRFLAMRTEDFVLAARLDGSSELRTIWKHMVPSFFSHIIASLTLAIPGMIIAETALSFLGLGLRSPAISWGVLLQEAQNIRAVATAPWLLIPGLAVIVTVLALNFLGDGLRDAADPYR
ncbi:MAG: ABC transporter permease [Caldilineaceae bacterium]|nr:ABC transporter permease [Caldilineaceae bacterium]HRW05483.1 ABC transporter permease [Caldilineaceae bacterium]